MTSLQERAVGYETSSYKLVPPSFNIVDRNKLTEVGLEIKKIYLENGTHWQDYPGLTIAVSFNKLNKNLVMSKLQLRE